MSSIIVSSFQSMFSAVTDAFHGIGCRPRDNGYILNILSSLQIATHTSFTSSSLRVKYFFRLTDTKTQRTHGRQAQIGNIAAARAVADIIRSTLGPRSMLKVRKRSEMLLFAFSSLHGIVVGNDLSTILKPILLTIYFSHMITNKRCF